MNWDKHKLFNYFIVIIFLFTLIPSVSATSVVINSKDWKDVYSGIMFANRNKYQSFFLNSPNPGGLFNILPKDDIILVQSKNPFVSNLEGLLRVRGYHIVDIKNVNNANIELMPNDVKNFYIIEDDYPSISLCAGSLASATNGWVLFVNDDNVNDVINAVNSRNANTVTLVGFFKRNIKSSLNSIKTDEISSPSKFKLSKTLAERFLEEKKVSQALVADGKYIESEILQGHSPVLLVGTNYLPKETMDFFNENGIKSVVVIGSHLTYIGEKIREKSNKKISVFVKFGQSTPGVSGTIYALTFMPLPVPSLNLTIVSTKYDPVSKKLVIMFKNTGNTGLFELTTFRVLDGNTEIASGGDNEPVFIGVGESAGRSYDVIIPADKLNKQLTVELYTSYGESSENLDSYITQSGKFGPPLTKKLEVEELSDKSDLEVESITYYPNRFGVKVKNVGDVPAFFTVKLLDVSIKGVKQSLSSKMDAIKSGEAKEVFITAQLDNIDLKENKMIDIELDYGENENALLKSKTYKLELNIASGFDITGLITGSASSIVIVIVIIVVIGLLFYRRRNRYSYGYGYRRYSFR